MGPEPDRGSSEEAEVLARLERLAAFTRKILAGEFGSGSAPRGGFGSGTLLFDHRRYAPGDDPRTLDWSAYARLDELFVRVFEPEDSAPLSVIVDRSRSMGVGDGAKARQAALVGASFAAIGLLVLAGATLARVPSGEESDFGGKGSLLAMLRFARTGGADGPSRLTDAVRRIAARARRGPIVLVTDGVPPEELDRALRACRSHRAVVLHIVDPAELDPVETGLTRYVNPESGRSRWLLVTRALKRRYVDLAHERLREIEAIAHRANAGYARVSTALAFDAAVMAALRRGNVTGRLVG